MKDPSTWTQGEVGLWLIEYGLGSLLATFKAYNVDGESLLQVDDALLSIWGVSAAEKRRLLDCIDILKGAGRHEEEETVTGSHGSLTARHAGEDEGDQLARTLATMFPGMPHSTVLHAMITNNYDKEKAIDMLITMDSMRVSLAESEDPDAPPPLPPRDHGDAATAPQKRPSRSSSTASSSPGAPLRERARIHARRRTMMFPGDGMDSQGSNSASQSTPATVSSPGPSDLSTSSHYDNVNLDPVVLQHFHIYEDLCELFPEQDPEIVETAIVLAKGDYDDAVEQLLSLNPLPFESPYEVVSLNVGSANTAEPSQDEDAASLHASMIQLDLNETTEESPYMSVTRQGFNDEDMYDGSLSREGSTQGVLRKGASHSRGSASHGVVRLAQESASTRSSTSYASRISASSSARTSFASTTTDTSSMYRDSRSLDDSDLSEADGDGDDDLSVTLVGKMLIFLDETSGSALGRRSTLYYDNIDASMFQLGTSDADANKGAGRREQAESSLSAREKQRTFRFADADPDGHLYNETVVDADDNDRDDGDAVVDEDDEDEEEPIYLSVMAARRSSRASIHRESMLLTQKADAFMQGLRWKDRPDVSSSGVLQQLSDHDVKRQEAIAEIVNSEQAYLDDVAVLIDLLMTPLAEHFSKPEASTSPAAKIFTPNGVKNMRKWVCDLHEAGRSFVKAMQQRQSQALVVQRIADILIDFSPRLKRLFASYCSVCFHLQRATDTSDEKVQEILADASADPRARALPINAFILSPIQRLARYPLLIKAVERYTGKGHCEFGDLQAAFGEFEQAVDACNGRLRLLEDRTQNERLDARMDYSRLESFIRLYQGGRSLIKSGPLTFTRVSKGKVTGTKAIECFLFTDLFMYAKRMKGKKGAFVVYKQVHRSLVGANELREGDTKLVSKKRDRYFELVLYGKQPSRLLVQARTPKLKQEWLKLFKNEGNRRKSMYEEWDCPRARAVRDYEPQKSDEIELSKGDLVDIRIRDINGRTKGSLLRYSDVFHRMEPIVDGWFPSDVVEEVESDHTHAKKLKSLFNPSQNTFTKSHK